jgi:hypothetical protein
MMGGGELGAPIDDSDDSNDSDEAGDSSIVITSDHMTTWSGDERQRMTITKTKFHSTMTLENTLGTDTAIIQEVIDTSEVR